MDLKQSLVDARKLQVQRTALATALGISAAANFGLLLYNASRPVEVVLQPVLQHPVTISSSYVSRDYLELVTRDTAYAVLNRRPQRPRLLDECGAQDNRPCYYGGGQGALLRAAQVLRGGDVDTDDRDRFNRCRADRLNSEVTAYFMSMSGSARSRTPGPLPLRLDLPWALAEAGRFRGRQGPQQTAARDAHRHFC